MSKKLLLLLGFIVVLFIGTELFSYSPAKGAYIQRAHLSKREKMLSHAGGAQNVMVFSYRLPEAKMTNVHYWVEVYQDGMDKGKKMSSADLIKGTSSGMITFAIERPTKIQGQTDQWGKWIITDFSSKGFAQSSATKKLKPFQGAIMSTEIKEEKIKAGEPITLAVIVKSPYASAMSAPEFNDREALIQESRGQKKVIVLRCKFSDTE